MRSFATAGFMTCMAAVLLATGVYAQASDEDRINGPVRPAPAETQFRLYFIGNTGIGDEETLKKTLSLLKRRLSAESENAAVVFLGDQLPEGGLPGEAAPGREAAESRLDLLVDVVEDFPGRVFVIPGETEYEIGPTPLDALLRQESYLESKMNRGNVFIPDGGLPGPHEVKLTDDIRMVALNTQWLLQKNPLPVGDTGEFLARETADVYAELSEIILDRHTDDLIVLGHHPIMSNGKYGGHYGRTYMIPVLGTAWYAMKRMRRDEQYFGGQRNEWMREQLFEMLSLHENVIYASAHDKSLQRFESERQNFSQSFIVSGSASGGEHVEDEHELKGYDTEFVSEEPGFMTAQFYKDGSIWMDAWAPSLSLPDGKRLYSGVVREAELNTMPATHQKIRPEGFADSTRVSIPSTAYQAGTLRKWFLGSNWRHVWNIPVELNYLDLETAGGGLNAVKRGGGMQTISVRLENDEGHQFVVRSVNKDGARVLPPVWQDTFIAPIMNDLMSYSHPFGVLPIPILADAAGVYHANPRVVWVPADDRLGTFSSLVGGSVMLFEERPNKDMSHEASFGNSKDVVGWSEMHYEVTRDNDNRVDTYFMARSRLFDMFLSDWDRHKDQWRWASFDDPDGNGTRFRPIPRDRDNAFNRINAFLYPVAKPFIKIQDFRKSYGAVKGLGTNGRTQDHRFLSSLSESEWTDIADSLKNALSDDIIQEAFHTLPKPIFEASGQDLIDIALVRRDKLPSIASSFYRLHARTVDVIGSNKHERFEVTRIDDDHTLVVVYRTTKEGEIRSEMYRRMILRSETREINLYGLGGNDQFIVTGKVDEGTTVNAVGGAGDDTFDDSSFVSGSSRKTRFYDSTHPGNSWSTGKETHVVRTDDPKENSYTGEFEFEQIIPVPFAWYNSEDGFILQLYGLYTQYGFRKTPAAVHTLAVQYATSTTAFSTSYNAVFHEVIHRWNVGMGISYAGSDNTTNFYGLGNETSDDREDIFTSGLSRMSIMMPFIYDHPLGLSLVLTPALEATKLTDEKFELLEGLDEPGVSAPQSGRQWFASFYSLINFQYVDQTDNPLHGFNWDVNLDLHAGLSFADDSFVGIGSALSLYTSLPFRRQITFATRFGAQHIFGTFPFYEANVVGGRTNLRGYASSRFSGRSNAFWNNDLRVELLKVNGGITPGRLGLLGFVDTGRVWTDGESSSKWHVGYGGGVWLNIVDEVLVNFTTGKSNEQNYLSAGLGFFF